MKKLLTKFFISNALNRGTALSDFWRGQVSRSAALRDHERSVEKLHARLKEPDESLRLPDSLHASIMQAVQSSREEAEPISLRHRWRLSSPQLQWGLATAMLLAIGLSAHLVIQHRRLPDSGSGRSPELVASAASLPGMAQLMDQFATNGAALLNRPLEAQIEVFSRDMQETARFLMASLP